MYITSHNININEENMNQTCGTVVLNNNNNNNNIVEDFNNSLLESKTKKLISMCFGCGTQITDQFILRVAPDLEWHAKCLKCSECGQYLDENCTCFVRNGKLFCKNDYLRLFSKKCFKCNDGFKKNDFVMRANNRIYHVDCFRCYMCNKPLAPGDEFAPRDDGLLCKTDNDLFEKHSLNNNNISNNNTSSLISMQPAASSSLASSSSSSSSSTTSSSSSSSASSSSSNSSSSSPNINTSCQNITNLQQHTNIMQKCVVDDLNVNTNDFEDNQNCLSPNQLHQQQQQQQQQYHLLNSPHSRIGLIQPHHQAQQLQNPNNSNSSTASTSSTSSSSSTAGNNPNLGHHQSSSGGGTSGSGGGGHHRKDKTTRVRTVLNEKQLHTLRTCYGANPRPDALMKEQLVEMTGLSPRVIRVWFQNKRCKDKKKTILIKQMQEQQKNRQTIGHGIPLIAGSPLRNDINNLGQGSQIEMQHTTNAYHHHHQSSHALSWKQMTEGFSLNGQIMTDSMNGGPSGLNNQNGMSMQQLQQQQHQQQQQQHSNYDQMMGFQSDEEDCFDQLSDQGGDDSVSSVGLDDTRIQQL